MTGHSLTDLNEIFNICNQLTTENINMSSFD